MVHGTRHTEVIPDGFTHALLLRNGDVLAAGPIRDVITAAALSECFGLPLELERRNGRWQVWSETAPAPDAEDQ